MLGFESHLRHTVHAGSFLEVTLKVTHVENMKDHKKPHSKYAIIKSRIWWLFELVSSV